jgi:hypothetical protein
MAWGKRNTRIEAQRARNAAQGRPSYRGTGKKSSGCPLWAVAALASVGAHVYAYVEIGRWLA